MLIRAIAACVPAAASTLEMIRRREHEATELIDGVVDPFL
jgi:hypothetical protein